jgi:tRNA(adenine34) deaminase
MSPDNVVFMREALRVAREGLEKGELPIGAVVVLNGEIIASAHTKEKEEGRDGRVAHQSRMELYS